MRMQLIDLNHLISVMGMNGTTFDGIHKHTNTTKLQLQRHKEFCFFWKQ